MQRLEGKHVSFQYQATGERDGSRWKVTAELVLPGAGTQFLRTYVERRQATVVERVALQPIFDVCVIDIGYNIGGGIQESSRCGGSKIWLEGGSMDSNG